MAQSLMFMGEPQTVTQWRGASQEPAIAAESLFIDDLTGDIVVTSLVGAHKSLISYSQARFYAAAGAAGSPAAQYSGECASSSSVSTTPSRLITSVTVGCRKGPSRPIVAARRFPRPIMMRTNAPPTASAGNSANGKQQTTAAAANNIGNSNSNSSSGYQPSYLIAVALDTRTIHFYTSTPHADGSAAAANSPSAADGTPFFTVGLGAYSCSPNSIRFRADFYHIRHFYWACNSVRSENAQGSGRGGASVTTAKASNSDSTAAATAAEDVATALSGALDTSESAPRSFYVRSRLLLGGGGMVVPSPPEVSDAAIRRTIGIALGAGGSGIGNGDGEVTCGGGGGMTAAHSTSSIHEPSSPTASSNGGGGLFSASSHQQQQQKAHAAAVERASGVSVSGQVARLHASLQRDHMLVVLTEISVDLVFVDFKSPSNASSSSGDANSPSSGSKAAAAAGSAPTSGGSSSAAAGGGDHYSSAVSQASRSGCDGMIVVLRRIPTRIDFWHSVPSLHVSVVVNHLKPTNVKPIAELGGFTWIMPQFRIAGLQPIPLPSSSTSSASSLSGPPSFMADMQVPSVGPSQRLPTSSSSTATASSSSGPAAAPPSRYFPLQVLHAYGELFIAFTDYSRGAVVMYRYQHNNANGAVVDMAAAMLRATERLQLKEAASGSSSGGGMGAQSQGAGAPASSLAAGGTGPHANISPAAALRYYTSAGDSGGTYGGGGASFADNASGVYNTSNLGAGPSTVFHGTAAGGATPQPAAAGPPTRLSADALNPYKRVGTVTHVAALVAEGQPMPNSGLFDQHAVAQNGGDGSSPLPAVAFLSAAGGGAGPSRGSFGSSNDLAAVGGEAATQQQQLLLAEGGAVGLHVDAYLPLSDAVANAVGALERASLPSGSSSASPPPSGSGAGAGNSVGTGGYGASNVPSTVRASAFTGGGAAGGHGRQLAASTAGTTNNFAFSPTGSLVHTYSSVNEGSGGGGGGCCTWEIAFVLPLPAQSILSALRSEWYFGADAAASYRWAFPNLDNSNAAVVATNANFNRHSVASTANAPPAKAQRAASALDGYRQSTATLSREKSSGGAAVAIQQQQPVAPLALRSPVLLQPAADGLIYAHFPDCKAPHYTDVPRGACHLVAAYDLKLAIVEGATTTAACPDGFGMGGGGGLHHSLSRGGSPAGGGGGGNIYGDPHTVERATQSVADAYEAHVAALQPLPIDGNGGDGGADVGRGTELVLNPAQNNDDGPSTVSAAASSTASPETSPSPRRGNNANNNGGNPNSGPSHSSIHGVSAFRALAGVSSYFSSAGSRDGLSTADEALLSPQELLVVRKQQWIRRVAQMRAAELSGERFVDVCENGNHSALSLSSSDVLWRELLQYLCARPHPDAPSAAGSRLPSVVLGTPHPSMALGAAAAFGRQALDGNGPFEREGSVGGGASEKKSGWFKSLFASKGGSGGNSSGHGGGRHEETDAFPYAPVVHHLPIDVLTSPFEGSLRVATGAACPLVALEPPTPHQPFVAAAVRHNALATVSRFDCYAEEVWGLHALRCQLAALSSSSAALPSGQHLASNAFSSPSRAASLVFGANGDLLPQQGGSAHATTAPFVDAFQPASAGIQLRRPHFGPGGHYQRSLCFAVQYMLNRRAHIPKLGGGGGGGGAAATPATKSAVGSPPASLVGSLSTPLLPPAKAAALAGSPTPLPVVIDTVSIVKTVLLRSMTALESQAAIGRLFDVIVAHHCQHSEAAAWYRYWRNRWEPPASSTAATGDNNECAEEASSSDNNVDADASSTSATGAAAARLARRSVAGGVTAIPDGTADGFLSASPIRRDIVARLPIAAGAGATIDASTAEFARLARAVAQPHLWPVSTAVGRLLCPMEAITIAYGNASSSIPPRQLSTSADGEVADPFASASSCRVTSSSSSSSSVAAEVAIVPAALDASLVYEGIIVPLLQQLTALASATADGDEAKVAGAGVAFSSQAAQAGYGLFKSYVLNSLFEYCRSTVQHGLSITVPIQSSLLDLLLTAAHRPPSHPIALAQTPFAAGRDRELSPRFGGGTAGTSNGISMATDPAMLSSEAQAAYFRLHQLLMYRALEDHIPTAMQLIALQGAYPPAFQMGLDILGRLKAHSVIVQVFIARRMPVRAAKYLLFVKGLGARSGAVSPVGVGSLPTGEDMSNIVAILECTAMLHDEERRAVLEPHVPLRPVKAAAVVAYERAVAKHAEAVAEADSTGGERPEPPEPTAEVEALRSIAAAVSYLDHRLAKKKLKYANEMTTCGALFCNAYAMLVHQWIETALRTYSAKVGGAGGTEASVLARGRYSAAQPTAAAPPVVDPIKAYPQLRPFFERHEQLKSGAMI